MIKKNFCLNYFEFYAMKKPFRVWIPEGLILLELLGK
jgi:hypothetical protein